MDKLLWRISLSETGERQFKVSIIGPDEMVIAYSDSPQVAYDNAAAKLVVKPWLVNDGDCEVTITSLRVRDLVYFDLLKRVDSYFGALYYRHRDKGSISGQFDSKLQEILGELRATIERRQDKPWRTCLICSRPIYSARSACAMGLCPSLASQEE